LGANPPPPPPDGDDVTDQMQIDVPATATDPESEIAGPSNSSAVPQGDRSADDRGIQRWIDWTVGGCKGNE
jgi:hypothetical protein